MRKGTSTFFSSGSTACPPLVAVHLRAGWSIGGVQDRYLRHDTAGDLFVGRTVTGLSILQPEFAALPPRFEIGDEVVQKRTGYLFFRLTKNVELVAEFTLVSLIYHIDVLRERLSEAHPHFQSPIFADADLLHPLHSRLPTGSGNDGMQSTGVPPHVKILSEIHRTRNWLKKLLCCVEPVCKISLIRKMCCTNGCIMESQMSLKNERFKGGFRLVIQQ
ncbi:hypothetical protein PHMEG_00020873 [Phytophthora megakarya]|uniref:Uncharacterized protein n=1 Tax=Phytophthora megakarya TaxID=4795 RepID=A0A225VN29_9STRA|nr:hypothetical protein PHMEG_00020873 [Phytophthora megakarya]